MGKIKILRKSTFQISKRCQEKTESLNSRLLVYAMGLALPLRSRSALPRRRTSVRLSSLSAPRHQPWQPKKLSQRWLLWAFYHVIFTDIGMFSHIVDIINFGIGFSIFQTWTHYIFDNQPQYCYIPLQKGRIYPILSIFVQDFCLIMSETFL